MKSLLTAKHRISLWRMDKHRTGGITVNRQKPVPFLFLSTQAQKVEGSEKGVDGLEETSFRGQALLTPVFSGSLILSIFRHSPF